MTGVDLDWLLANKVDPVLRPAGFRRKRRTYTLGRRPGRAVTVQFRSHSLPDKISFFLEWGADPAVSTNDLDAAPIESGEPFYTRLAMPPELAGPTGDRSHDTWKVPLSEADRYADALAALLIQEYVPMWRGLMDRPKFGLTTGEETYLIDATQPTWAPAHRIALNFLTATADELDAHLRQLEEHYPTNHWVRWWRQAIDERKRAEQRG